ncbi:MAG: hypothetical protein ACT4QC_10705 [Planctomycetaceae bacterium]
MRVGLSNGPITWLLGGLLAGLGVAYFWPHEPAYANTVDRDKNFAIITVPVGMSAAGINDPLEGVFVLDFLTGQLKGAVLNRQVGKFASFYVRDLSKDFSVDAATEPRFAIASGYAGLTGQRGMVYASGIIYVAELTTGRIAAYAFPFLERGNAAPMELMPLDAFQWRPPTKDK